MASFLHILLIGIIMPPTAGVLNRVEDQVLVGLDSNGVASVNKARNATNLSQVSSAPVDDRHSSSSATPTQPQEVHVEVGVTVKLNHDGRPDVDVQPEVDARPKVDEQIALRPSAREALEVGQMETDARPRANGQIALSPSAREALEVPPFAKQQPVENSAGNLSNASQKLVKQWGHYGETQRRKVVIACIGDSITFGDMASKMMDYPAQLQKMIGPEFVVRNFGHSRRCMLKNPSWSYWKSHKFQDAIRSRADIVVLMFGTNDGWRKAWEAEDYPGAVSFKKDYKAMLAVIRAMTSKPAIYLMIPPPVYRLLRLQYHTLHPSKKPLPTEEEAKIVNTVIPVLIREIHLESQVSQTLIDIFETMGGVELSHPEWSADGIHPNDAGYKQIAIAVKKRLVLDAVVTS